VPKWTKLMIKNIASPRTGTTNTTSSIMIADHLAEHQPLANRMGTPRVAHSDWRAVT
jgi:hypothetical protein